MGVLTNTVGWLITCACTGAGAGAISQFRFVQGDFNFDGVVNCADRELLVARQGATLDDTEVFVNDRGTPEIIDDIVIPGWWKWQGRGFNSVAAMLNMNATDGSGGANSASVTAADLAAFDALFPSICPVSCPGDLNGDTFVDDSDFVVFASAYNILDCTDPTMPAGCPADLNGDQFVDDSDFVAFATAYNLLDCTDPSMPANCPADFNGDGFVDDSDFVIFANAYNQLICP